MRIQKIRVTVLAVALAAALAALPTTVLADDTLILPDSNFQNALIAVGMDTSGDGKLTAAELAKFSGNLDLHDKNISNVSGLGYMVNLKSLNLNDNRITSIPSEVGNCRELTSLDIGSNQISALPVEITTLTKLTTLKLGGTALGVLPAQFNKLTALETLDISSTSFTTLPTQIQSLPALTALNAANLGLSNLPAWLGQCSGLQSLNLDGNSLSAMPDLSALSNLTVLTLNSNDFSALPTQVCALPSLQRLEMCYNSITTLRAQINLPISLTALRLTGNRLEQLPAEIGSLTGLKTLELGSNSLMALPATLGNLTQLRTLDVSGNKLSDLPTGIFQNMSLQSLNLNFNYLNPTTGADLVEINKASGQKQYTEQTTFTGYYTDDSQSSHTKECYQGESITVAPISAPEGQSFVGWDLNADGIADTGADGSGTFVATDYREVTVIFMPVFARADQFAITFLAGDHGRVNGSTSVRLLTNGQALGQTPDVQADEEYRFLGWQPADGGSLLSSDQVRQQSYSADAQYTAQYTGNSANLSALSADRGTWSQGFYPFSYSYVLLVPGTAPDTGTVTLTAALQGAGASVSPAAISSGLTVDVAKGQSQTVTVIVTAPDTKTQKTYTVKVVHADENGAALSNLELSSDSQSAGTVEDFNPAMLEYHVNLSPEDDTLHIQTSVVNGAVVAFRTREGGSYVPSTAGVLEFNVSAGVNFTVWARVTSPDGYTQKEYTLYIVRQRSTDCTLNAISGSQTLTPRGEIGGKTCYSMQLPENTAAGTIYFTKNYRYAKVIVTNATPVGDTAPVTLDYGESRVVELTVVAQDGTTQKTYAVTVTRDKCSNANLGTLTLDYGTLQQNVSADTLQYTAFVPFDKRIITINAGPQQPYGTVSLDGDGSSLTLAVENGQTVTVPIVVTAQNGATRTYSLRLTRETIVDLKLSELNVAGVTLNPGFSADTLNYTVQMPADMDSLPISVTRVDDRASVSIAGVAADSAQVSVAAGQSTPIQIIITSPQGATRTYTLQVTRDTEVDLNLASLNVAGVELNPSFNADTLYYTVQIPAEVDSLPISVKRADSRSSVSIGGIAGDRAQVFVPDGKTTPIKIVVTGPQGAATTRTYTITATRAAKVKFIGTFPANKLPAKANAGTAVIITPQKAPAGFAFKSISFSSSKSSLATVDSNDKVTFVAGGKPTITVTMVFQKVDKKGKVTTKKVTLKKAITILQPVSSITFSQSAYSVIKTKSLKLNPTILPSTASNKNLKWTSSNPKVASVSSAGVVLGKAAGQAIIFCTSQDGSKISASYTVTVLPIQTQSIKLAKKTLTIKAGKTGVLKATVNPGNSDYKKVTWTSTNPAIAPVDANTGKIKGVAKGTSMITATTADGKSASCYVTIN